MSSEGRSLFYDLSDCRSEGGDKTTLGIFFTNCMVFQGDDTALFPTMARVNHACNPTSEFVTRRKMGCQDLMAVKPISKGEEITLSYLGSSEEGSEPSAVRMEYLRNQYAFRCVCRTCSSPRDDALRSTIKKLQGRGSGNLLISELERMVDGLERIQSKVVHLSEIYQELLDRAIAENDGPLAIKAMSSVYMFKNIIGAEDAQDWMRILKNSNPVVIGGTCYMFPPVPECPS